MVDDHRNAWNTIEPHIRAQLTLRLTPRQHDVLVLWLAGCSYTTISDMLRIKPWTVRTHLHAAKIVYQQIRQEAA